MGDTMISHGPGKLTSWLSAVALLSATGIAVAASAHAATLPSTTITIDGTKAGPAFSGVGAISGGGGNSRYLIDYPPAQRNAILDYLFKPHFGANIQMLKIEIGGDANSSDGAEPSAEHSRGTIDSNAGYEWWLAEQAVARNPAIRLYGLQWAAPGWADDSHGGIWGSADIAYLLDWLGVAKQHGLTISYLGGWNERYNSTTSPAWFKALRAALNANGYASVQIVAADQDPFGDVGPLDTLSPMSGDPAKAWTVANDMAKDPAFARVVAVIGAHDTCGYPTTGTTCVATATARSLGKPLWESELGAMNSDTGAAPLARSLNNAYIQAGITGFAQWPLIDSMPPNLPHEDRGLIWADQPWNGYFHVNRMTWVTAQTTQFTQPGWRHAGGANRMLSRSGYGSYNTYQAPDHSAWSMNVQTTQAAGPQNITVHVTGGLPAGTVHVWSTSVTGSDQFVRRGDLHPSHGTFTRELFPGYVYTFTTTTGQSKGAAAIPASGAMPLPYAGGGWGAPGDSSGQPRALAPQDGAFGYAGCADGSGAQCVTQLAGPEHPVWWKAPDQPYAVTGWTWQNYTVGVNVLFTGTGQSARVIGRFNGSRESQPVSFRGYELTLNAAGGWALLKNSWTTAPGVMRSGTVTAPGTGRWTQIALRMSGSAVSCLINGVQVASFTDAHPYTAGPAGIGTGGFYPVQFKDFATS
jgi:Glycosyl hydrolase family 59/Galactocerebrosidase, C-terminal lectin domain